jgi:thiol-disulfide isomerase/thioredoxin
LSAPDAFITYNGAQLFKLNKLEKTIRVESKPPIETLSSSSWLQFAIPMWRNVLPKIIADKTIPKTLKLTTEGNYLVEFSLDRAFIESGLKNEILPIEIERKSVYRLTIDKTRFLPFEVYRGNNVNDDFNRVRLTQIIENPPDRVENSWFYSTYVGEYKPATPPADNLIKAGAAPFGFDLPLFGKEKSINLDDFKGQLVLLEFWIFHCGACQAAVPKLNKLDERYSDNGLKILAVNINDSPAHIKLFSETLKPEFPLLQNGESVAKQYGVSFYPTVVLIGKDGTVIYSGVFDEAKIDKLIGENITH